MTSFKCYDIAKMVIDEANKRFSPDFEQTVDRTILLYEVCNTIDKLSEEFCGSSLTVDVDEDYKTIIIEIECPDMVIRSPHHVFYDLASAAKSVRFAHVSSSLMSVEFVFPGVWEPIWQSE